MNKRVLIIVALIAVLGIGLFVLTGCGNNTDESSNERNKTMKLGDIVETDIVKLSLYNSQLCIALDNTTSSNEMFKPKEYDATKDIKNPYVASKGHTLVSFTIKLENLDRGSLDLGGGFNSQFTQVKYNENNYNEKAKIKARSKDNIKWETYSSENILLLAGETYFYRGYIDIETDANLSDDFDIIFYLPNSKGESEKFNFHITKNDLENYVEPEISLHDALSNFSSSIGYKYIKDHCSEFEVLTGTTINEVLNGRQYNVIEKEFGTWTGTFKFQEDGRILEGGNKYSSGYTNKRTWKVENDMLVCTATPSSETKTFTGKVRKITDSNKTYYLAFNGENPYLLIY